MPPVREQDLIERFGAGEIEALTAAEPARLARALSDAEAEANGYLGVRHRLPLTDTPPALVARLADMARYRLYDEAPTEEIRARYDDALAWLKGVAAGRITLGLDADQTPAPAAPVPDAASAGADFSMDHTRGF